MPRIQPIDESTATGVLKDTFEGIRQRFGTLPNFKLPNFFLTSGVSPAFAKGHLDLMVDIDLGGLSFGEREQIAVAVAQYNGCRYCLSAHTLVATHWAKLDRREAALARRFLATDPRAAACLAFTKAVLDTRGAVSDEDLEAVRAAGLTDEEIVTIIAEVSVNNMRNYLNRTAQTELDPLFPLVDPDTLETDVPLAAASSA